MSTHTETAPAEIESTGPDVSYSALEHTITVDGRWPSCADCGAPGSHLECQPEQLRDDEERAWLRELLAPTEIDADQHRAPVAGGDGSVEEAMWRAAQRLHDDGSRELAWVFARLGYWPLPLTTGEVDDLIRHQAAIRAGQR